MYVLVAMKENGGKLSLGDKWDRKRLAEIRASEKFFCPECKEEVIMKLGSKRIWHFSHLAGSSCEFEFERESEYHLSGKLQIFQWLKSQGIEAELERFDPLIRQKPDIAFEWEGRKYAVEFQSSVITEEIFMKRTNTYLKNGYTPLWIAAGTLVKRAGGGTASLSNFLYLFIRQSSQQWSISAFCPLSSQFINLQPILPLTSRKIITSFSIHPMNKFFVQQLIFPSAKNFRFFNSWQNELQKFKFRSVTYPGSYHNPFLNELYKNHLNLLLLPPEIGLPVFSAPYIETPPLIWQTYLYVDFFRLLKKGESFSVNRVESVFFNRVRRQQIKLRLLPGVERGGHLQAIREYMQLLASVTILKEMSPSSYVLDNEMKVPSSIEEQNDLRNLFFKRYGHMIEGEVLMWKHVR